MAVVPLLARWATRRCGRSTAGRPAGPALAPRVAVLERLGIFATASRAVLEQLAGEASEVQFSPGSAIVREGEEADSIYVLLEGEVQVTAGRARGPGKSPPRDRRARIFR